MQHEAPRIELILSSAVRLFKDAELLMDHKRYASAFALGVLGLEEIGKALLKYWELDRPLPKRKASAHLSKQAAVASLLLGSRMAKKFPKPVDVNTLDIPAIAKEFNESEEGRVFVAIRNREMDKKKQNALYQDDDVLTAVENGFAEHHVGSLFKIALEAQEASTNPMAHRGGRAMYDLF
jgi:AbiV family abortive infection protein